MSRSKPNGRVCMFLVGASLILVILLSYKWFMVPSGVQKERKSSLYYRQQRLQKLKNERNSFGKDRGRNFFNDRSLTGSKKYRYEDDAARKTKEGMADSDSWKQHGKTFGIENTVTEPQKNWDKDGGSEENVGKKDLKEVTAPAPKEVKFTGSVGGDSSIKSLYKEAESLYTDTFNKMIRIVHLDLKGSPPNMEYLKKLLPFFKTLGATGLLIEYEDMFPYSGKLAPLAAKNCYSTEDIQTINKLAQDNNLDIIPLIQTFGHMEFALKLEFAHLREDDKLPLVIHPGKNETYDFLYEMIDQVLKFHSGRRFLHIGSDEVYTLGRGKSKDMLNGNTTKTSLFFKHVKRVAKYVKEKHALKPVIWDDMFRHVDADVLKASKIGEIVSPMVWSYVKDPRERLPRNLWKKYRSVFSHIWIASAFKGATGVAQFATDPLHHIRNHLSWVDIMKKEILSEAGSMQLMGVTLTGWSRYDHFAVLCELLPGAIPSLAASLQIMSTGGFTESNHKKVSDLLQCKKNVQFELCMNQTADDCQFPGSEVYYEIRKLWRVRKSYSRCMESYHGWVSEYNIKYAFSSPFQIQRLKKSLINIASNMSRIEKFMWNGISALYDNYTAAEWIDVNLRTVLNKIPDKMKNLNLLLNPNTWQKRPFNILISPPVGTKQYQKQAGQNQVPGQNTELGQNQFQGQNARPGQNQFPGQNRKPGQNQFPGQNPSQGLNQLLGQNPTPRQIQFPGQNPVYGFNQNPALGGQNQFKNRDSINNIQNLEKNQFPGQNQPAGQGFNPKGQRSSSQGQSPTQLLGQQKQSDFNVVHNALKRARSGQSELQGQAQGDGQNKLPGQSQLLGQRQKELSDMQKQRMLGDGLKAANEGSLLQNKINKLRNSFDAGSKMEGKAKEGEKKQDMSGNVLPKPPSLINPAMGAEKDKKDEKEKDKNQGGPKDEEKKDSQKEGQKKEENIVIRGSMNLDNRFQDIGKRLSS